MSIYRYATHNGTTVHIKVTGIDTATAATRGICLESGKHITVKYDDIGGYCYFTEREIVERFPNAN